MKNFLLFMCCCVCTAAYAQWTTLAEFPGEARNHPVVFSIDGKAYVTTGFNTSQGNIFSDGFQYDPELNQWSPMAEFAGGFRGFAAGASLDGKGYLGFGLTSNSYENDLWSYDPETDSWTELAPCPCLGRRHPAFVATENGKIVVGLGDGTDNSGNFDAGFDDWWVYDIASNSWEQATDFPGFGRHHPYYFSIGTDVFVGFGDNHDDIFGDFYKFDAVSGNWTTLNDFPFEDRVAGAQFAHDGFGYIVDGEGNDHQNLESGEFYRYDPATDEWTTLASHIGDGLWAPSAFVIDDMAYVVGGDDDDDNSYKTLWAYDLNENRVDDEIASNNDIDFELSGEFYDNNPTLQWVDCNNNFSPLNGETGYAITIPEGESYALIVEYSAGGKDTSACYESRNVLSLNGDLNEQNSIQLYPNPATNFVYVESKLDHNNIRSYVIIGSDGATVQRGLLKNEKQIIDVKALAAGNYVLQIQGLNQNFASSHKFQITK